MEPAQALDRTDMENVDDLINVCKAILNAWDASRVVEVKRRDPIRAFLENYAKVAALSVFDKHQPYFLEIYEPNRPGILNTIEDDSWIDKSETKPDVVLGLDLM